MYPMIKDTTTEITEATKSCFFSVLSVCSVVDLGY
jgi:hypothetical protein